MGNESAKNPHGTQISAELPAFSGHDAGSAGGFSSAATLCSKVFEFESKLKHREENSAITSKDYLSSFASLSCHKYGRKETGRKI